ncbi:MAG TPA: AMP-binding protein [Mycobacteriales bacterium]
MTSTQTSETEATAGGLPPAIAEALASGTLQSWWAQQIPDAPMVLSDRGNRTWAEMDSRANQLVRALRSRGVRTGDAIALICSNRPEFLEVVCAAQRSGLRLTPVNWHLTAAEAAYVVDDCEATALVVEDRFVAAAVGSLNPRLVARLSLGDVEGFDDYEAAVSVESSDALPDPSLGSSMMYTSGTTGRPKGVSRPQQPPSGQTSGTGTLVAANPYVPGKDLNLVTGPLYHAAPLVFSFSLPTLMGAGVVLMDGWDAEEALALVARHGVTHTHMVPTMFHRLLSLPQPVRDSYDLSSLRSVWHGAAPCPVPVKQALIEWLGPVVLEYYAATEGVGCVVDSEQWLARPGTVGRPEDEQVRVFDDEGNDAGPGVVGTVYLKAPDEGRFEYHGAPEKTAGAYRDNYFTLGDVGFLDADGWLYLTDRSANLIISGGVNIYPAEVEAVLITHPDVGDVGVIGVPNDEWGEEVKAVVELQPGVEARDGLEAELIRHCREHLASFKVPRSVDFIAQLPRADNGKLYKESLRAQYRAARG